MLEFTANKKELIKALNILSTIVSANSPKPILSCIRLSPSMKNQVMLQGTDLEISISYIVEDSKLLGEGTESTCVNLCSFKEVISKCNNSDLHFKTSFASADVEVLEITSISAIHRLKTHDPDDFPILPIRWDLADTFNSASPHTTRIETLATPFVSNFKKVDFAKAKAKGVYPYHGILLELYPDTEYMTPAYGLIGTDGRRLAWAGSEPYENIETRDDPISTILQPKLFKVLDKVRTQNLLPETMALGVEKLTRGDLEPRNQTWFDVGQVQIISREVEGEFPEYRRAIPKNDLNISVPASAFLGALTAILPTAGQEVRKVELFFDGDKLMSRTKQPEFGESSVWIDLSSPLPTWVEYKEEHGTTEKRDRKTLSIDFNPDFLMDFMKSRHLRDQKNGTVHISLKDEESPLMAHFDYEASWYLLMPITLN